MGGAAPGTDAPSTRDKLIDAAFRVVARDGLAEASVKAIAAEAGVTAGLTHYHFASKDALIEAAIARGLEDYLAELDLLIETEPAGQLLAAYTRFVFDGLDGHRDLFRVRLALAVRAMNDPGLSHKLGAANAAAQHKIATIFAIAGGAGEPGERHVMLARTVKASFEGMMLSWLSQPDFPIRPVFDLWQSAARVMLERIGAE